MMKDKVLAIIPARAGSKGLLHKNRTRLAGHWLIEHTIQFANTEDVIDKVVISTDDRVIIDGFSSPYVDKLAPKFSIHERQAELAEDNTPIWAVLQYILTIIAKNYKYVVLLEPTSPLRRIGVLSQALFYLADDPLANGIIAVTEAHFNPVFNSFVDNGYRFLEPLYAQQSVVYQRQQAPTVYHHSGEFYIFRREFIENNEHYQNAPDANLLYFLTPRIYAHSIDTKEDLDYCENLLQKGVVTLPWVKI